MRRLPPSALLGCAAILVDFIGLGMIAPILPSIVSDQDVGNILTAQYLAVVIGQVIIGTLADCFGRRRMIIAVMLFDAVLFASTGFTKNVVGILVLRLLAGFAAPVALGISYVASVSRNLPPARAQLNFICVGISFNAGSLIGAATGGLLGPEMWMTANLVAGIVPLVVAVWAVVTEDVCEDGAKVAARSSMAPAGAAVQSATQAATASATPPATAVSAAAPSVSGLRAVLLSADFWSVMLSYVTNGCFQGSFFSLMPVALAQYVTGAANASTAAVAGAANATEPMDQQNEDGCKLGHRMRDKPATAAVPPPRCKHTPPCPNAWPPRACTQPRRQSSRQ